MKQEMKHFQIYLHVRSNVAKPLFTLRIQIVVFVFFKLHLDEVRSKVETNRCVVGTHN